MHVNTLPFACKLYVLQVELEAREQMEFIIQAPIWRCLTSDALRETGSGMHEMDWEGWETHKGPAG